MTKHRDVNKCRRKEKCKMDALIRQANKQVRLEMASTPETKKKERMVEKKRRRERERKTTTLSEKKEEARHVSEQRDKGWIHVIRVHDTTRLAVTTRQGNRHSRTTPHKERMSGLVKHRDYPPHSYIVNERCNSRNKRASQEHSSGAVWESRWTSWTVRPNEPSGFRGRKDLLNRASALVTTCP